MYDLKFFDKNFQIVAKGIVLFLLSDNITPLYFKCIEKLYNLALL